MSPAVQQGPVRRELWCVSVISPPGPRRVRSQESTTGVTHGACRGQGGTVADQTYTGEFYCVKCKAKREATGNIVVSENGTRMAKGKCPVCGTNLNRILGKN